MRIQYDSLQNTGCLWYCFLTLVSLWWNLGAQYKSRDVLEDPELREGIKKFSNWPTIPQVFVDGEFIGGCDILMQMHENGELAPVLKP